MIARTILISLTALTLACESEPEGPIRVAPTPVPANTTALPVPEPEPEPEPVALELPEEPNALVDVEALKYITSDTTMLIATANAAELAEIVGGNPPKEVEFGPHHGPEIEDLHPTRLEAMGLDPTKPVGIAIRATKGEVSTGTSWSIFATIKDEAKFRDAFALEKKDSSSHYPPPTGDKRKFFALDNGEIIIAARSKTEDTSKPLAEDVLFERMRGELKFGRLATVFIRSRRTASLSGFGFVENNGAIQVVSDEELEAAAVRLKFPEYLAGTYPELPYLQRIVNLRAEMDPAGRSMRQQITELERAPRERRLDASKAALDAVETVSSSESATTNELFVASRLYKFKKSDLGDLFDLWLALGQTEDETQQIEDLKMTLENMVVAGTFTPDEINKMAEGAVGDQMREMSKNLGQNPEQMMGGLGGLAGMVGGLAGGGDDKKGGGGPMGMLGGLSGIMGGLGGGGAEPDLKVSSKSPVLRAHGKRRARALAMCWARSKSITEDFKAVARLSMDKDGSVKLKKFTGVPSDMKKCAETAMEVRGLATEAPVSGSISFHFTHKK